MKVFISWSGELSRELGEAFRSWLPSVLQVVKSYFTPSDVEKGARWSTHIAKELAESRIGVFCLTRENLSSDWIMFEAGAISKVVGDAHVCPILFSLEVSDLTGPLSQFQVTQFNKTDMHKLISTINEECGDQKLLEQTRDDVFEMWWPKIENQVSEILKRYSSGKHQEIRSDREILDEILSLARVTAKQDTADHLERSMQIEERIVRLLDSLIQKPSGLSPTYSWKPPWLKSPETTSFDELLRLLQEKHKEEGGSETGKSK